jgi:hypothetical protein
VKNMDTPSNQTTTHQVQSTSGHQYSSVCRSSEPAGRCSREGMHGMSRLAASNMGRSNECADASVSCPAGSSTGPMSAGL